MVTAINSVGLSVSSFSESITVDDTPPVAGMVVELSSITRIDPYNAAATVSMNLMACQTEEGKETVWAGPEVIKLFSCSTQLSAKFILLINVKMPTIVGILTFISMINTASERLKATNFFTFRYFSFYEQLKFRAQLS